MNDTKPALPEPFDWCYEWDGPYGTRKFSAASHNGMKPARSVPIYRPDQMHAYADQRTAAAQARIAELTAALETARNGLQWYQDTYPDAVNGCDDEAMEQIDAALAPPPAQPAPPSADARDAAAANAERYTKIRAMFSIIEFASKGKTLRVEAADKRELLDVVIDALGAAIDAAAGKGEASC